MRAACARRILPVRFSHGNRACVLLRSVEWVEASDDGSFDYTVSAQRAAAFYGEVRKYWPALPDGALVPDYAGVRPKLLAPNEKAADFYIRRPASEAPGLVNLFGIESPGLTASLAIAEYVADLLQGLEPGSATMTG